ncbi:MAG: mechanosensitive ion channel family protein [Romboutsia sp.]|uniref:mechanosensitive ion channel family protein n=1 Tax=Romboutsia sp. TaxID=1965302 RepID=UPI003F379377
MLPAINITKTTFKQFGEDLSEKIPLFIYALLLLGIGVYVSRWVKRLVYNCLLKYNISKGITNFIVYGIYISMLSIIVLTCLEMIGVETKSVIAVFGAAGFSVGLAFKEILSNLGSGMIILFFRPFKIGDYIQGSGVEGSVEDIQIFSTVLKTPDNKTVIVPNFKLTSNNIVNYTQQKIRRIDFAYSVAYNSDVDLLKNILSSIFREDNRILSDPKPIIGINSIHNNTIQIVGRPWVDTDNYWDVYFDIMENVKKKFDENNIVVPFLPSLAYHTNNSSTLSNINFK